MSEHVTPPTVAFFCMDLDGHFRRLRPLISALAAHGMDVVVFTDRAFEAAVGGAGARFVDLFAGRPLSAADATSRPFPCRYVTFAGRFGDPIIAQARAFEPQMVITDSFAVIGRVVAAALDVPYVNVCAGHNLHPARLHAMLAEIPRVGVSDECHQAVERLRDHFGLEGASPFSYVAPPSPFLNVYCEPPQYLTAGEREVFEPVVFFGSLSVPRVVEGPEAAVAAFPAAAERTVYVSFGTVVWRYYASEAIAALKSIAAAVARSSGTHALISLGGAGVRGDIVAGLEGPNVRVLAYVDQWRVLEQAHAFVTHHGLNSTHEAVFHRVPMLSHPFFWDQPALARKAQAFGLAVPLGGELQAVPGVDEAEEALERLFSGRARFDAALGRAYDWEQQVIAARPAVVRRIAQLA
jgi:UDP:flavonoid glycosyltransferase YjiC (YdhE family)